MDPKFLTPLALALAAPLAAPRAQTVIGKSPTTDGCNVARPGLWPALDKQVFTGASSHGVGSVFKSGPVYSLRFVGDETIEYQIDVSDPEVATGVVRVYEVSSGSYPLHLGGPGFLTAAGHYKGVKWLTGTAALVSESMTARDVILEYEDHVEGVHRRRHTYTLVGKTLRVRIQALDENLSALSNYSGVVTGGTAHTKNPKVIQIQGGLAIPLIHFRSGPDHYYVATQLDQFQSNASNWLLPVGKDIVPGPDSIDFGYSTQGQYYPLTDGFLAAPLDDTINLVVSSTINDTFVTSTAEISPYRAAMTGKTVVLLAGGETTLTSYGILLNLFEEWGLDNLAAYSFSWWSSSDNGDSTFYPAADEVGYVGLHGIARNNGVLLGEYTMFWKNYISSPHFSYLDHPLDSVGLPKGTNLAESARLAHALRETSLIKKGYDSRLVFQDVMTYASPSRGVGTDDVDQNAASPWAKTLRQACFDRKVWLSAMRDLMDGPLLGEASIATQSSNMEALWLGYVDGVQRTINTDSGKESIALTSGDPLAPTRWPVIPDYELRVFARKQANHGNGFYHRFFSWADTHLFGSLPEIMSLPLPESAMDRYRVYEVTYGHASFFATNGPFDGGASHLRFADMIKEYYLMNALQRLYLESPVVSIRYLDGGLLKTFDQMLADTGTLDAFVDPQIVLGFDNGLEIWVNHGSVSWVPHIPGSSFAIPEDGFYAHQPSTGFVAFSGAPGLYASARFDYCYAPNEYEFFDGRNSYTGYGNLVTTNNKMLVKNFARDLTVRENDHGGIETTVGTPPTLVRVRLELVAKSLLPGQRTSIQAQAEYSNGAVADVTSFLVWTSSNKDVASVTPSGVVTARCPGTATFSALDFEGLLVDPVDLSVVQ